jgi:hypothetical protein
MMIIPDNVKVDRVMDANAKNYKQWSQWFKLAESECKTIMVYDGCGNEIPYVQKINIDSGEITVMLHSGKSPVFNIEDGKLKPIEAMFSLTVFELRSGRGWSRTFDLRDVGCVDIASTIREK